MVTAGRKNVNSQAPVIAHTFRVATRSQSLPAFVTHILGEVAETEKAYDIASTEESPHATCGNELCALTIKMQRKQNTLHRDVVESKTIVNRKQKGDVLFVMCC